MQALYLASECAPFIKTGGLADVIGAVPKALAALGVHSRVMLPAYPALAEQVDAGRQVWQSDASFVALFGGTARVLACQAQGLDLLLFDAPHLYHRDGGPYQDRNGDDYGDNAQRFAALAWVAAQLAVQGVDGWRPDVVHAHDWQAGLIAAYLKQMPGQVPPCITTIHNIAFQGLFDPGLLGPLGLSGALFHPDGLEYYGRLGFLKAGLAYSHAVTTVSPTYARELMRPEFGMGLEGLLHARQASFHGILNGIDLEAWNPADDPHLLQGYEQGNLAGKAANKVALAKRFGIEPAPSQPLFCVVSRLTRQKGLDLLLEAIPALVGRGAKLVVLGTGDRDLEAGFKAAAHSYPASVGCVIGYDEGLSHLMQGGADAILIPSRFEPCGLTQLYGLRYGTIPVVARTGGLADTVIDANEAALARGCATGILHDVGNLEALMQAVFRACDLYSQADRWQSMMRAAMEHPVGWQESAKAYRALYCQVLGWPDNSARWSEAMASGSAPKGVATEPEKPAVPELPKTTPTARAKDQAPAKAPAKAPAGAKAAKAQAAKAQAAKAQLGRLKASTKQSNGKD